MLLLLSPARVSFTCVDEALDGAAGSGAELVAYFILDTTQSEDLRKRIHDMGFLGEAPSDEFMKAMRREHELQGREELSRIGERAAERGVPFRSEFVVGDFLTSSLAAADREQPEAIFVARRERSAISRLVEGSAVRVLEASAPCEVLVHDEDNGLE
jgi:nucleotide-binding universal stress UspA family protein